MDTWVYTIGRDASDDVVEIGTILAFYDKRQVTVTMKYQVHLTHKMTT